MARRTYKVKSKRSMQEEYDTLYSFTSNQDIDDKYNIKYNVGESDSNTYVDICNSENIPLVYVKDSDGSFFRQLWPCLSIIVDSGIIKIDSNCFENSTRGLDKVLSNLNLNYIDLGDCVEIIDDESFYKAAPLNKIIGLKNLREIGTEAFRYAGNINNDSKGFTSFDLNKAEKLSSFGDRVFQFSNLSSFVFPKNLVKCGEKTLDSCLSLQFVDFSKSKLSVIPNHTCYKDNNLLNVNIGNNIKSINNGAFESCTRLQEVDLCNVSSLYGSVFQCDENLFYAKGEKLKYIKDAVTQHPWISTNTFRYCYKLSSVYFPNIEFIGGKTFSQCKSLLSADFPYLSSIHGSVFDGCSKLSLADFPELTVCNGVNNFIECTSLSSIYFPKLSSIGSSTFQNCTSLTSVNIPNLLNADYSAFQGCTSLPAVEFKKLSSIGYNAFQDCKSLTSVNIPKLVSMGNSAFQGCTSLPAVEFKKLSSIEHDAFNGCTVLTSVNIPDVKILGYNVFTNCSNLDSISFLSITTADALSMETYPWGLKDGCIVTCKDGQITVSN